MKWRYVLSLCVLVAFLSASVFTSVAFADKGELEEVTKAIKEKNSR